MTYKELREQIKNELKKQALIIRRGKFLRKPNNRLEVTKEDKELFYYDSSYYDEWKIKLHSRKYRNMHIAYCQFFNNTLYSRIETPKMNNKPNEMLIDKYKTEWASKIDATEQQAA